MTFGSLILAQLMDPFRIGLVVFLLATTIRTSAATGRIIPLALGVLFVAVLIPTAMPSERADVATEIAAGLIANSVLLAVALGCWSVIRKVLGAR